MSFAKLKISSCCCVADRKGVIAVDVSNLSLYKFSHQNRPNVYQFIMYEENGGNYMDRRGEKKKLCGLIVNEQNSLELLPPSPLARS